jgi:hypothetical protein
MIGWEISIALIEGEFHFTEPCDIKYFDLPNINLLFFEGKLGDNIDASGSSSLCEATFFDIQVQQNDAYFIGDNMCPLTLLGNVLRFDFRRKVDIQRLCRLVRDETDVFNHLCFYFVF